MAESATEYEEEAERRRREAAATSGEPGAGESQPGSDFAGGVDPETGEVIVVEEEEED